MSEAAGSALTRGYGRLMEACGVFAGLVIGLIAVLVVFDVVTRNATGWSAPWILEIAEYGLPLATFAAAPWVLHHGAHVRIDMLLRTLPHGAARGLGIGSEALGLAISVMFLYLAATAGADAAARGNRVIKVLTFPEWWLFVPVCLSFALLAAEFARRLWRALGAAEGAP